MSDSKKFDPKALVNKGMNKALESQQPLAAENVARLRRVHPDKSPAELISYMNNVYLAAVTGTGAAAGASAVVPNLVVQIPVTVAEALTFLEVSVLYTLSVAEIHQVNVEDVERRRLLVTSVLLGNSAATTTLEPIIGRTVPHWGKQIVESIPMTAINKANKVLGPRFITKYGTKQGVLVLAKQIPLAIGVGVGAAGNHIFGRLVVKAAKEILGPPPVSWD